MLYQDMLVKQIAIDKGKIFNQSIESILGRKATPSVVKDFDIIKEKHSHREWLRYKDKTVGYFDMGYTTDTNFQPKLNLTFCFTSNSYMDQNIARIKEDRQRATIEEKERQEKVWTAAEKAIDKIFSWEKESDYPHMVVNRLKELGFQIELKRA